MAFVPRIGVYICHCGVNIAAVVNTAAVTAYAGCLQGVVVARDYTYMCSDPGQALIMADIHALQVNRVVVASCSPRMHEPTFRAAIESAGLNPYCLEMANIREQCAWVHTDNERATRKAMELVAAAVGKAARLQPLQSRQVGVQPTALVIGGGIAGLRAALDIARAGKQVVLVERAAALGGNLLKMQRTFPTLEPVKQMVRPLIDQVTSHPQIQVLTSSQVVNVAGYVGNFQVTVAQAGEERVHPVGVIIVATGFEAFDARLKPEFGYGQYPQVLTSLDFEKVLQGAAPEQAPRSLVFIQCVGSRDHGVGNTYCSRSCCMVSARQALEAQERWPDARVTVMYMDMRAFGKGFEQFYDRVREQGVIYRRGNPSEINRQNGRLLIRAEDTLLGELVEIEADLAILAVGMVPRRDTHDLAGLLKLSRSPDGFYLEAHPKLRPVDTAMAGIYLAGCCQGPKDIADTVSQARAAAAAALIPLLKGQVQVEGTTSFIDEELCAGCGQCAEVCAYGALQLHPVRGVMTANAVLCQGCGACAATCPSGAIDVNHFRFTQTMAQIQALAV